VDGEEANTQRRFDPKTLAKRLGLTLRQAEIVCSIVVLEKTVKEIAKARGISRRSVEDHLDGIYAHVGVTTRVELAKCACQAIRGPLDAETVTKDGRLNVRVLGRRLRLPLYLAHVVRLVWEGKPTKKIALALERSHSVVENYRHRIHLRLHVCSLVGLVRKVYEELTREGFWRGVTDEPSVRDV
jgi:DNA-binding NarL/FixJ family response regulator